VDVSLARIVASESAVSGEFAFTTVTDFEMHTMPSAMHELSPVSAVFEQPINVTTSTDIAAIPLSANMTSAAILLQNYFAQAGFTPLASEWWHFDDPASVQAAANMGFNGEFVIGSFYSVAPG